MKIIVYTKNAKTLLNKISTKIIDKELKTWEIVKNSENNNLFSHTPDQWKEKAMLKPEIKKENLELILSWWKGKEPEERVKGYILGRFIEVLVVHFRKEFDNIKIE